MLNLFIFYFGEEIDLTSRERDEEETGCHDDFPGNSDIMWMKMALMTASKTGYRGKLRTSQVLAA